VAAIGDGIELRGPIGGHFVWETADGGPLLLIGGGSGVVPLMSMIRNRADQGSAVPTLLLLKEGEAKLIPLIELALTIRRSSRDSPKQTKATR
jgi:NAD(P)H-flavin reductase